MFGNLVSGKHIRDFVTRKEIMIIPFDERYLKHTHYTLRPGRIYRKDEGTGDWNPVHAFSSSPQKDIFLLKPNEYVLVEVKEIISISLEGIVGRFISTSNHIEAGLMINAGQIDNKYGTQGEAVRFGVKNLLDEPNQIRFDTRLAHLQFFDCRGIVYDPIMLPEDERFIRMVRKFQRADDDGPTMPEDMDG